MCRQAGKVRDGWLVICLNVQYSRGAADHSPNFGVLADVGFGAHLKGRDVQPLQCEEQTDEVLVFKLVLGDTRYRHRETSSYVVRDPRPDPILVIGA